jgi:hypothetical protein
LSLYEGQDYVEIEIGNRKMKYVLGIFIITLGFSSCAHLSGHNERNYKAFFEKTATYLSERLPSGTTVAVIEMPGGGQAIRSYLVSEMIQALVDIDTLVLVNRNSRDLEQLRNEIEFQLSGDVDDTSAALIGHLLGVESLITVSYTQINGMKTEIRVEVQAIDVENAQIQGNKTAIMDIKVILRI